MTKDKAVGGLIGTAMDLGVLRICMRFYKVVSILFVFRDVILKASKDRLFVSFGSDAGFWMVRYSCEVRRAEQGAKRCKELSGGLYTIIDEEIR